MLGYKTIAVCSPHNFDLVRSYGAEETVDYNDERCIEHIRRITRGGVRLAVDCVSAGRSFEIAAMSFAEGGGRLNTIVWPTDDQKVRKDVEIVTTLMYTFFGQVRTISYGH